MDRETCRRRFALARVARLATVGPLGPHLVPVVFAVEDDHIYSAVDHKPKRTRRLQRLANIEVNSAVSILADHYDEDWEHLWWVRADGEAKILRTPAAMASGLDLLADKYPQYRHRHPEGPVIAIAVETWTGWTAS